MSWIIDPSRTWVFVFDFRNAPRPELAAYLHRHFPVESVRWKSPRTQIDVARNLTITLGVSSAPEHIRDFVFFDEDMRPDRRTDAMFETPGDVVGCQYPLADDGPCNNAAWLLPTTVHCGAMRFSREIARRVELPAFRFSYDAKHTACTGCECGRFVSQVLQQNGKVVRAGWCDHDNDHSWRGR